MMNLTETIKRRGGTTLTLIQHDVKRQTLTLRFGDLFVIFDSVDEFEQQKHGETSKGAEQLKGIDSYSDLSKTWYIVQTSRQEISFHTHRAPRLKKGGA